MKKMLVMSVLACALPVVAKGLLPFMVERRGITNEQIDRILEKHPNATLRLTAQDWRGMRYQLYRYHNMTNYVEKIGSTNDCARVLLSLHDAAETAAVSNRVLSASVSRLQADVELASDRILGWMSAYANATNSLAVAEARAARAEALKAWLAEQRDKALLPSTKAIYQAILDRLEGD